MDRREESAGSRGRLIMRREARVAHFEIPLNIRAKGKHRLFYFA